MEIDALRPADTPDYMLPAWLDCLHWAIGDLDVVAAFRADTGLQWTPGRTVFEQMIDEATEWIRNSWRRSFDGRT